MRAKIITTSVIVGFFIFCLLYKIHQNSKNMLEFCEKISYAKNIEHVKKMEIENNKNPRFSRKIKNESVYVEYTDPYLSGAEGCYIIFDNNGGVINFKYFN